MTDTDIDGLLAAGNHEAAALAAARIIDPAAYGAAMIRCFEASKRAPTSSHSFPLQRISMLSFTKHVMRLVSLNVRRELAGKNPADGRTASDLKLVVKGGNDLLDKLSPHLRGSFYMADTDAQGVLLPQALTKRIHPLLTQDSLAYDLKCMGYQVTIDHAGNEESAIVLDGCGINDFRLNLEEGGTVAITMRVQYHPALGQLDPLADKLQQEVVVTMTPPRVPVKAEAPPQGDLITQVFGASTGDEPADATEGAEA